MAKRTQIGVNLPTDVERTFNQTRFQKGSSNTRFVIAGLLCYLLADPVYQEWTLTLASLVDEDKLTWTEAVKWIQTEPPKRDAQYQRLVEQAIERDIDTGSDTPPKRRSGQKG
jgi:hypothetical protein